MPVDFTVNTEIAIRKAIELADINGDIVLHLLYVQNYGYPGLSPFAYQFLRPNEKKDYNDAFRRLNEWKKTIEEQLPGIKVSVSIDTKNEIQKGIEKAAASICPDLIIIGKKSRHSWFTFLNTVVPSRLIRNTGVPVLTVKPGSIYNKLHAIVVPIGDTNGGKMKMLQALCANKKIKVYLASFINDYNKSIEYYKYDITKYYQWLRTELHSEVEYSALHGRNRTIAILNFAKKVDADMIILNPETEAKVDWLNRHISDLVEPTSKLQILLVKSPEISVA
jgi:nucleotide-binding universal stress UspA family protein